MTLTGNSAGSLDFARDDVKIIRARLVVPMDGEAIENGAVAIAGNEIVEVGRFADLKANHRADVLDLGEQILLPGLINAHCHLDYTMLRGKIPPQRSFTDWIRAINALKAALSPEDYLASIAAGLGHAKNFGTTTIINLEAFPDLLARMPRSPLRIWWCTEMIDFREPVRVDELNHTLNNWFQSHKDWLGGYGLAPHAPYTASASLYSKTAETGARENALLTTHLAESAEEMEMFRDSRGALYEFLISLGRDMSDCGGVTPVAHFLKHKNTTGSALLRSAQNDNKEWLIAHMNELTESDFDLLSPAPKFNVVHCPRSHTFFGHSSFELKKLRALGFNVCLGTDSLASNSSLSLFSEMRELLRKEPWVSPREVLAMATVNGAQALGLKNSLGQIRKGALADFIAIPHSQPAPDIYETIVAFEESTPWMMVNGALLNPA